MCSAIMFLEFARSYLHVWNLLAQAILGTWSDFQLQIHSWVGNICPALREISWCIWRAPYILWIMAPEQRRHLITTKGLLRPCRDLVGFSYYSWGACYNSFELHVCCALPAMINYFNFFLCFHIFMSMPNFILFNIHFMDMKRHMLIF
jgi:hypothetical protein